MAQPGVKYGPLTYTHRLLKGVTQISNYGLRLMTTTSLPEAMKCEATKVVEVLSAKRANCLALAKTVCKAEALFLMNLPVGETFKIPGV